MSRSLGFALAAIGCLAGGAANAACGTGKVVFSDAFDSSLAKVWGDPDKSMSVKTGQMVLTQSDGDFYTAWADPTFRNVDFCVTLTSTDNADPTGTYGGVLFWMRDTDNFYTLQIRPDGYADVYEYNGDWTAVIDDKPFSAVKAGKGVKNELRVVTHAGTATLYINGTQFDKITVKDSPGTSHVGLMVDAPSKGVATFTFDDLAVHEP